MGNHHKYSPSQLDRIAQCPGSVRMAALYQRDSSPQADEGTLLHSVMAARLRGEKGAEITPEQEELIRIAFAELAKIGTPTNPHIEERLSMRDWMGNVVTEGTADLWWLDGANVHLVDWKFGRMPVSPNSLQFSAYAQMAYQACDCIGVNVHVVMPRLGTTATTYVIPGITVEEEITAILNDCEQPGMHLRHGQECQYCPAAHECPEARAASGSLAVIDPCALTTAESMESALHTADMANAIIRRASQRIADIRAAAVEWLTEGKSLSGWELKPGRRTIECADLSGAFAASGMPAEKFIRACTLSVPKLAALHADDTGMSEKAARKDIEAKLAETLREVRGEYQLVRKSNQ